MLFADCYGVVYFAYSVHIDGSLLIYSEIVSRTEWMKWWILNLAVTKCVVFGSFK